MSEPGNQPIGRGGSVMRLRGLIRKEFLQIVRDPSSMAIAFLMPAILLFLFGYGVSLDAKHIPIALIVDDKSEIAENFASELGGSDYFRPQRFLNMAQAQQQMMQGKVQAIVRLREDFSRQIAEGSQAAVQVIVNGIDANYGRLVLGYIQGAWAKWLEHTAQMHGQAIAGPVNIEHRIWFNAEVQSRNYLVPGLIALIMTLIGALLTAMVMAREWERGTLEALLVTPARVGEVLVSKLAAYYLLGVGGMLLSVGMAVFLFGVPLRGSFAVLFAASSLFLLAALGMGLLISTVTRNQFVAGQTAIIVTYLPAFLLSGFIFDIASMPWLVRGITHVVAARYFVAILQTVFLAGDIWSVILPNAAALAAMAAILLFLVRVKSSKRLE
ncbi:MAG: ABC transporter permease [Planctomycetaceae bacterium]|nr:ABC transporter permease [Planctomycetaceae bacterium]